MVPITFTGSLLYETNEALIDDSFRASKKFQFFSFLPSLVYFLVISFGS